MIGRVLYMKKNIGSTDKWVRIVLGVALLLVLFLVQSGWRWVGLAGVVLIATALVDFCPLYALLHMSTRKGEAK